MFEKDITQTYSQQDATIEIIIMLAGAFLLGFLLSWLINKLIRKNKVEAKNRFDTQTKPQEFNTQSASSPIVSTARKAKNQGQSGATYKPSRIDDLTKISGINSTVQTELNKAEVNSYTDLRDIKTETLMQVQEVSLLNDSSKREIETWPHQAGLAAKGEWKKLSEYQAFTHRAQVASQTIKPAPEGSDDLKLIEGIGPKIEEILNAKGVYSFKDLQNTDSVTLKQFIVDTDKRFERNETESWPHQAGMAEKNQWEELEIYQEFMDADSSITIAHTSSDKTEQTNINYNDRDDLKKIEGIGPNIEEVLNDSGIYTYTQLYNADRDRLKKLLNGAGSQFQEHEPESWPHQAGMANRGEWEQLKIYQDFMSKSRELSSSTPQSSQNGSASLHVKSVTYKTDDLKKIDGIGPKIEKLLNSANITSFKDLQESSRDEIKRLLDDAGPQYRLHEPDSWPHQAKLAFKGEWEKLDKYQDTLTNGLK